MTKKKTRASKSKPAEESIKKLTLDDLKNLNDLKAGYAAADKEFDYEKQDVKFSGKTGGMT